MMEPKGPTSSSSSSVITTSTATATTTTSSSSSSGASSSNISLKVPFQILEITVISAQDLTPVSKSMRTYAVTWVQADRKLRTRVDQKGNANPRWNDKFLFRIDDKFLNSDSSAVMMEIYTQSWLRDTLVGTVRVLVANLIPPSMLSQCHENNNINTHTRFVALQVRRPSGTPQGILNMGVSLLDTTMPPSMQPLDHQHGNVVQDEDQAKKKEQILNEKIQLWRSRSTDDHEEEADEDEDFPDQKNGSIVNGSSSVCNGGGSMVNDQSELCSDVGPSASVVAAAIAHGLYPFPTLPGKRSSSKPEVLADEAASSILEDLTIEEATAKGYKSKMEISSSTWRAPPELPPKNNNNNNHSAIIESNSTGRARRHSDGGGLFSCFGNAYGFEFTIVCGANNTTTTTATNNNNNNKNKSKKLGTNKIQLSPSDQKLSPSVQ
uniref:C2 domain-containing protein n=1 Tax=Davidia involucrata TaxID=16924 RepID=A0A5B6YU78_DAVIN